MPGLVAGIGAVALALGGLAFGLAPSASADGTPVPDNPTCSQFIPGTTELKVEPVESGSHTDGTLTVDITVRTLSVDDPAQLDLSIVKLIDYRLYQSLTCFVKII